MTQDFRDMIYLFSCGARGIKPQPLCKYKVENIFQLAMSQNIWPTVFLAVKQLYDNHEIDLQKSLYEKWKLDIMQLTITNTQRNVAVYETIQYLEANGIKCCVLKGEAVARLYHTPICRVSTDSDILIDKNHEKEVQKLLKNYGYKVEYRPKKLHHINCYHPIAGHVEVHVSMYSETTDDIFLNRQVSYNEKHIQIKCENNYIIDTLGIMDGLVFLTIHFIKHFINKGAGIRQLMDLLLYMRYYKNEINWTQYNNLLKYLKYDKLINSLLDIGVNCLNFSADELPSFDCDRIVAGKVLSDIEEGGIFGHKVSERKEFYSIYLKERFGTFKTGNYIEYMNRYYSKNIVSLLFPNYKIMLQRYPYIQKSRLLLVVAWTHRWIELILNVVKRKKSIKQYLYYTEPNVSNETVKKRMELIRELDMI